MQKAEATLIQLNQDELPKTEGELEILAHSIKKELSKTNADIPLLGVLGYMKRKNSKHLPQLEWLGRLLECKVAYVRYDSSDVLSEWAKEAGIEYSWTVNTYHIGSGDIFSIVLLIK